MGARAYRTRERAGTVTGGVSFWYRQIGVPERGPALPGDRTADVCVVGGGLTGLWTAYHLAGARPDLRVVVLEKEFAGYGASGRNGGWLSAELSGDLGRYAATGGRDGVRRLVRAMERAVDEVIDVCRREGIDADVAKDGVLLVARSEPQRARLRAGLDHHRAWGIGADHARWLTRGEVRDRVRVEGALGGVYSPHGARVQPAALVRGLAGAVRRRGVTVHEGTEVTAVSPGRAVTRHGTVRAEVVLRCLEGWTAALPGQRRAWLPMNSSMVVTEPLPASAWAEIGWAGAELVGDGANAYSYAQRTADGRIAIGGRGVPYRFGSRTDTDGVTQRRTVEALTAVLHSQFPATLDVPLAHAWCGVLGVPRDWCASVTLDRRTGLGWAGGYVGSGLTTAYLAARTLADLVLGRDTEAASLPWAGRPVRRWEPEPLRWLGVRSMYALYRAADRREAAGLRRPSRITDVADLLTGR
ncbi:NAD(P)/FAD-dependent oxidoreductase [Geodermatophilus marinus]|uniref:NAD(P)/FAD-dependent oxidoreductase n=1 Tax=Geodermatophilus sp. LHW52908 TaxID=2303986 RepID=UPI000E3C9637|nr:FAD-dependent oxidoreductase [Geodermatophilus sp. LHW52908]RFU21987.1 FAD-dependent oxidoreductase [Geodermatophilus sp. LHW52908]